MSGEAPVFIGFLGDLVPDGDKTAAEALSKFGGQPVWIDGNVPESFPFICSHCGAELDFVCQIATPYCANKRCLYLFGCHKQTTCGKTADGWMVVRGVVEAPASAKVEKKLRDNLPEHRSQGNDALSSPDSSDWLQAAFGYTASASSCSDNGCRQSGKTCEPEAASSQKPGCTETPQTANELMPAFFVRIEDEPPDNSQFDATGVRARQLQLEYEQREAQGTAEEAEGNQNSIAEGEEYEESPDKVFLKLQKRLSRSPKQAIRYSFGGKPLFISPPKGKAASVPPCPHCGSDRVFEMQLVPAAAEEIEKRRHSAGAAPVEWGVVAVFTCRKDCIPASIYTVEHVVAQEIL